MTTVAKAKAAPRRRAPRLEAGKAPTEQMTTITPSEPPRPALAAVADPEPVEQAPAGEQTTEVTPAPAEYQYEAPITGPEQALIRGANDTIDWARSEAERLQTEAIKMRRLADMGQEQLTATLRAMFIRYNLDPAFNYRVDLERGMFVPVGPVR